MSYTIDYACVSHAGKYRRVNQDNFICYQEYLHYKNDGTGTVLKGSIKLSRDVLMGVFDGMGGEAHGEIAAYLAATNAAEYRFGINKEKDLRQFYQEANERICTYADRCGMGSMGSTAAMLLFTGSHVWVSNVGDSRIYRFSGETIVQLNEDHIIPMANKRKPPLSQNLGIPETEFRLSPYVVRESLLNDAVYLICSDGLTDMVKEARIAEILAASSVEDACALLLGEAMKNGGKDNITILLCRVLKRFGF